MTFETELREHMDTEQLRELAQHGADTGWPGLTYYTDTVALHDAHDDEIWNALYEDADSHGVSILEFIASFGGAKNVGSMVQLKNLLTWYMAERIAAAVKEESE